MKSFKFGQNNGRFSLEGAWTPPGWDKAPAFFWAESGEGPTGFKHWKSLGDRLCGRDDDDSAGSGNDDTIGSGNDDTIAPAMTTRSAPAMMTARGPETTTRSVPVAMIRPARDLTTAQTRR